MSPALQAYFLPSEPHLGKFLLLAAARGAHEAQVDVVVGAREPLAAGGHGDGVGGHGKGQRGPRGAGAVSTGSLARLSITTKVWSLTYSWAFWSVRLSGP